MGVVAAGAAVALFGRFAGRGLAVLINIILARRLGPAVFGIYALGLAILRIGKLGVTLGLDQGVLRFGTPHWRSDRGGVGALVRRSLFIAFAVSVATACFLVWAAPWIEKLMEKPDLSWALRRLVLALPFAAVLSIAAAATRMSRKLTYSVIAEDLLQSSSQVLLTVVLLAAGWGLAGAVTGLVLSYLVAAAAAMVFVTRLVPSITQRHRMSQGPSTAELLSFSLQSSIGLAFTLLTLWLDRLVIGLFRPASEVGVYQAVAQLAALFPMVLNAFMAILWPMFAEYGARRDFAHLGVLFRIGVRWGLMVATPLFLLICIEGHKVLAVVFDSRYLVGATPLVVLALGQMANAATGPVGPLLLTTGSQRAWFVVSGCALAVNLVLNLMLVPRWGMIGAAIATSVSIAGLFGAGLILASRRVGLVAYDRHVLRLVAAATAAAGILLALRAVVPSSALGLVLSGGACGGVFVFVLMLFPAAPDEQQLLAQLRSRLGSSAFLFRRAP